MPGTRLSTGQIVTLSCGNTRTVLFSDSREPGAKLWCDSCDGMRNVTSVGQVSLASLAVAITATLDAADITTLDESSVTALQALAGRLNYDRREALAARKRALWREQAVKVSVNALAALTRTEVINGDLGWNSSVALVRRTDTGQHYVVSTNDEETLTWRSDADGNPYMSTDPHMPGIRESVVEAAGGRGMTRAEAIQIIDRTDASRLISGFLPAPGDND